MNKTKSKISAIELDRRFDAGEEIDEFVDWDRAKIVEPDGCRVEVNVPTTLIKSLDKEARRKKLSRNKLIELWVVEQLKAS